MKSALSHYLTYYQSVERPKYAVLVTGEWGVGKTYQVGECLANEKQYYVSLYGLKTAEEVHAAVLAAISPRMEKLRKGVREVGQAADRLGGRFKLAGSASALITALLRKQIVPDRTLVFDDFERCNLGLRERMGIINTYVEHYNFRVVVIAHEKEIGRKFDRVKEKLIGHSIRVKPQTREAFNSFLNEIKDPSALAFIKKWRYDVLEVFAASNAASLRILRFLVGDVVRLFQCLRIEHVQHSDAIKELVGLFSALNVEVRMGNLKRKDVEMRVKGHFAQALQSENEKKKSSRFAIVANKYPFVDLESQTLKNEVLIDLLFDGRYEESDVQASLDDSRHFLEPVADPPWKIVMHFDELDDSIVDLGVERLEEQFVNRNVTDSGEMLHMFALRLMMSANGIIEQNLGAVKAACIQYIDDLSEIGRLPPREKEPDWNSKFNRAHDGYRYWVSTEFKDHFDELLNHLIAAREKALENLYPRISEELLDLVGTNARGFYTKVCHTRDGGYQYSVIPVLAHVSPEDFVGRCLEAEYSEWSVIRRAMRERLKLSEPGLALESERPWALEVRSLFEEKWGEAVGFKRLRIERSFLRTLPPTEELVQDDDGGNGNGLGE